jgi:hypothetical protein
MDTDLAPHRDATLTPWFPPEVQPCHEGVYQRSFPAGPYTCWDGRQWRRDAISPMAAAFESQPSPHQAVRWRGLSEAPAAPCGTCRGQGVVDQGNDANTGEPLIEPCRDC